MRPLRGCFPSRLSRTVRGAGRVSLGEQAPPGLRDGLVEQQAVVVGDVLDGQRHAVAGIVRVQGPVHYVCDRRV